MLAVPCWATIITIEADDFTAGTTINYAYQDFALYRWSSSSESIDPEIPICTVLNTHPSGDLGNNSISRYDIEYWEQGSSLFIDVNGWAKSVSITALGKPNWLARTVICKAWDQNDNQVANNFKQIGDSEAVTLNTIGSQYNMSYIRFDAASPQSWDHIVIDYQPIPEPATVVFLVIGLSFSIRARKRRS